MKQMSSTSGLSVLRARSKGTQFTRWVESTCSVVEVRVVDGLFVGLLGNGMVTEGEPGGLTNFS